MPMDYAYKQFTYDSEAWRIPNRAMKKEIQKFAIACLYDGKSSMILNSPEEVANTFIKILNYYKRAIIWAHNWRYDISLIDEVFLRKAYENGLMASIPRQDPFYIFLKKGDHILLFNDTTNFFKGVSLKKLAELFNTKHRKTFTERDYKMSAKKWNEMIAFHKNKVIEGVKADAITLYEVVREMQKYFKQIHKDLHTKFIYSNISIPQIAFRLAKRAIYEKLTEKYGKKKGVDKLRWMFSHHFKEERIKINETVLESYYGGRVEAFILNYKPEYLRVLDVNSLYPYVMRSFPYPTVPSQNKTETFIADVKYECKKWSRVLPVITKYEFDDGEIITEVYTDKRKMTSVEVKMIEESPDCKIISIENPIYFESEILFNNFIDYLYRIKQEATEKMLKVPKDSDEYYKYKILRETAKLIMNSSYGKFGQHKQRSKIYLVDEYLSKLDTTGKLIIRALIDQKIKDVDENAIFEYNGKKHTVLGKSLISIVEDAKPEYHVPIASFVTAYARLVLYQLIEKAGKENVFYGDTDSIFTNDNGYYNLRNELSDTELGKLKLEEDKSGYLKIFGKKYYLKFDEYGNVIDYTIKGIYQFDIEKAIREGNKLILKDDKGEIHINIETGEAIGYQIKRHVGENQFIFEDHPINLTPKKRLYYVKEGHLEIGYPLEKVI
ncbi:type B DNA polymerase [Sulfolobus ellipsoid virus 1]|uniref:DNA-directed DNA polymerase n=1 Tax=Sulfolobus ellipsoid virus 1 TaxID=2056194 RepID=A0A2H4RBS0_9VIRU|nr:DNA polymerase [Sulfolobus ellipsoid virus 1]ATY46514.1 type B DNA polymerase [Sulfolobus ellipsoid virus 1]